jgi:hypothetical protein
LKSELEEKRNVYDAFFGKGELEKVVDTQKFSDLEAKLDEATSGLKDWDTTLDDIINKKVQNEVKSFINSYDGKIAGIDHQFALCKAELENLRGDASQELDWGHGET